MAGWKPKPKVIRVATRATVEMEQMLPRGVIQAIREVDPSFDSQKLLESIIHHFGGMEKFAFQVVSEFRAAPAGSMVRQRILDMMNRLTMNVTAHTPPMVNAADMDDDELMAAAASAVAAIERKERERAAQVRGPAAAVGRPGVGPRSSLEEAPAGPADPPPRPRRGRPPGRRPAP